MLSVSCDPLVSVVIPAYNAERFIGLTLASVIGQTYHNIEVIVVDDGSSDNTASIARNYCDQDERIQLFQQPNAGVAEARNFGIKQTRGTFIAPLDADDIWYSENLEMQVKMFLSAGSEVGLVYSWWNNIDERGKHTGSVQAARIQGKVHTTLLLHDFIANASSVLIRRSCLEQLGGYDSNLRLHHGQGGEDWDLYLRIASKYEFRFVPKILIGYRKVTCSMSTDSMQMARSRELIWKKINDRYPRIPPCLEKLSNSSYYLHLAAQKARDRKYLSAAYWVLKALRLSPIATLLNPGFFHVIAAVPTGLFLQSLPIQALSVPNQRLNQVNHAQAAVGLGPLSGKTWGLKTTAELMLHAFASSAFRSADQWI